jgi:hypothetical protein
MSATETDDLDWIAPPDADASNAALKAAIQAELTEARGVEMRFLCRLDAEAETEDGRKDLPRLSNAAVKAARALRQIGVLQLEIAGMRDQPGSRPAAAAPANQDAPKPYVNGPKPRDFAWAHDDYTEYDDYKDWELSACRHSRIEAVTKRICKAVQQDLIAHGRPDAARESLISLKEMIRAIPHPALEACLNDIDPGYAYVFFGEDNVRLSLQPPTTDVWAEYDADKALYSRDPQDSS